MREIKFRAWDKETNKMFFINGISGSFFAFDGDDSLKLHSEIPLMQYTGLKDKNGEEIYEGDIVKVPVEINKENFGEWSYREIKFNNGGFLSSYLCSEKGQIIPRGYTASFLNEEPDLNMKVMLWGEEPYQIDQFEIVGNIYENPELLNPLSND